LCLLAITTAVALVHETLPRRRSAAHRGRGTTVLVIALIRGLTRVGRSASSGGIGTESSGKAASSVDTACCVGTLRRLHSAISIHARSLGTFVAVSSALGLLDDSTGCTDVIGAWIIVGIESGEATRLVLASVRVARISEIAVDLVLSTSCGRVTGGGVAFVIAGCVALDVSDEASSWWADVASSCLTDIGGLAVFAAALSVPSADTAVIDVWAL